MSLSVFVSCPVFVFESESMLHRIYHLLFALGCAGQRTLIEGKQVHATSASSQHLRPSAPPQCLTFCSPSPTKVTKPSLGALSATLYSQSQLDSNRVLISQTLSPSSQQIGELPVCFPFCCEVSTRRSDKEL
ncbi:hypothetical protein E2542_SST25322 [Spatholobus suberectus]|nr:hypothetical protein E2542_SST25322 [Spatholobus suberectus]